MNLFRRFIRVTAPMRNRVGAALNRPVHIPVWLGAILLVLSAATLYQSYDARKEALNTAEEAQSQVECQAEFNRLFYKISAGRSKLASEERKIDRRGDRAFDKLINSIVVGSNTNDPEMISKALNDYQSTRKDLNKARERLSKQREDFVYPPLSQEGSCDG